MTLAEIDQMLRALELLPHTDDFRVDQAIGLAHDRLLMMWAEATRAAEKALDAANVPADESPGKPEPTFGWRR